jgi:hypothetical protein
VDPDSFQLAEAAEPVAAKGNALLVEKKLLDLSILPGFQIKHVARGYSFR